jgi:hypothetical protein
VARPMPSESAHQFFWFFSLLAFEFSLKYDLENKKIFEEYLKVEVHSTLGYFYIAICMKLQEKSKLI